MKAELLRVGIGKRLRLLREQRSELQEDVARVARSFGLHWTRATVAAIETGRRSISLEEFFLFPQFMAPSEIAGVRRTTVSPGLTLADFLPEENWVTITPTTHFRGTSLRERLIGGGKRRLNRTDEQVSHIFLGDPDEGALQLMAEWEREAEQKAARKLNVHPMVVVLSAHEEWGRGFTAERDRRVLGQAKGQVAARRLQALRGHVTRQLLKELESKIKAREELSPNGRVVRAMRRALKAKHLSPRGREKLRRRLAELDKSPE